MKLARVKVESGVSNRGEVQVLCFLFTAGGSMGTDAAAVGKEYHASIRMGASRDQVATLLSQLADAIWHE